MSKINDGGPAFPCETIHPCGSHEQIDGLSIRDYFAAKAMQAATSGHIAYYGHESNHWQVTDIAKYAYIQADAMLRAREAT